MGVRSVRTSPYSSSSLGLLIRRSEVRILPGAPAPTHSEPLQTSEIRPAEILRPQTLAQPRNTAKRSARIPDSLCRRGGRLSAARSAVRAGAAWRVAAGGARAADGRARATAGRGAGRGRRGAQQRGYPGRRVELLVQPRRLLVWAPPARSRTAARAVRSTSASARSRCRRYEGRGLPNWMAFVKLDPRLQSAEYGTFP